LTAAKVVDDGYAFGSTSLQYWENKEEPLQGLDFELGGPVFDRCTRTRAYVGGFFYQSRLAKDVNGFRFRTETSLTPWFSLDTIGGCAVALGDINDLGCSALAHIAGIVQGLIQRVPGTSEGAVLST
jgi:hypothetical protein